MDITLTEKQKLWDGTKQGYRLLINSALFGRRNRQLANKSFLKVLCSLWTRKDLKSNRLQFDGCLKMIFLVSTKLLWAEKSFYPLGMCSVCQNGNKISRPWYCGTEGRSEEHVARYKVMTEPVMSETCSQASIQEFQTVPSSGYRSYRNPSDFPFLLPYSKWLAIPAQAMLPYWWSNRWPPSPSLTKSLPGAQWHWMSAWTSLGALCLWD